MADRYEPGIAIAAVGGEGFKDWRKVEAMADSNDSDDGDFEALDVEIAPIGTKALLGDIATALREDEDKHRKHGEALIEQAKQDGQGAALAKFATEKADGYARLAGRVEALLLGWEG